MTMTWRRRVFLVVGIVVGSGLTTWFTVDPVGALVPLPRISSLPSLSTVTIDPALQRALQTLGPDQEVDAVVTLDDIPSPDNLAMIQASGVLVKPFQSLPMVAVRGTKPQILGLVSLPGLRSIAANHSLAYFLDQSVPGISADRAWNELGVTGRGVTVAVIDSGIDGTHPDLPFGEKVIQNVKVVPDLFGTGPLVLENQATTDTTSGHGTHVASIVAGTGAALSGKYTGVAPGAHLVGVGTGEAMFVFTALEGFDWVLENHATYGIRVISNSWGTTGSFSPDDPINVASRAAHDAGLVVVFAAGNAGPDQNSLNPYCVAPWVVCVAAGQKDGATVADFSSRGIPGDPLYHPTITAPGVNITAARTATGFFINTFFAADLLDIGPDAISYAVASGTSMATPHVSGTVALMLEANPALNPDQIKSVLEETAAVMPGHQPYEVGAGYLNAYQAVNAVRFLADAGRRDVTEEASQVGGSLQQVSRK